MTRLDHNRAKAQLAAKAGKHVSEVEGLCIWGNHSATQYPDIHRAAVAGTDAMELIDMEWYTSEFIPTVQQRGAAIIDARGASSAASAANAAIDHMHDWVLGSDGIVSLPGSLRRRRPTREPGSRSWAMGGGFHGVSLAAVDGQIVHRSAHGWANVEHRVPNGLETRFRIGLASMRFTAAAVGTLAGACRST